MQLISHKAIQPSKVSPLPFGIMGVQSEAPKKVPISILLPGITGNKVLMGYAKSHKPIGRSVTKIPVSFNSIYIFFSLQAIRESWPDRDSLLPPADGFVHSPPPDVSIFHQIYFSYALFCKDCCYQVNSLDKKTEFILLKPIPLIKIVLPKLNIKLYTKNFPLEFVVEKKYIFGFLADVIFISLINL